jgi:replicative DNA helicase
MSVAPQSPAQVREPPKNLNAERTVLGAALIDNSTIDIITDVLECAHFYATAHQEIFSAIKALHKESLPIEIVSVAEWLDRMGKLDAVGGAAYLAGFEQHVLTTQNIEHYCLLVRDSWQRRELIQASYEIVEDCHRAELNNDELTAETESRIKQITQARTAGGPVHISDIGYAEMEAVYQRSCGEKDPSPPVFSGIRGLDEITGGFYGGEITIIAARPNVGKTIVGINIACYIASTKPVLIFSLEMGGKALHHRMIGLESVASSPYSNYQGIHVDWMRQGFNHEELLKAAGEVNHRLCQKNLWLDISSRLRVDQLSTRSRRMASEHDLGLILIDYAQLLSPAPENRRLSKVEQYEESSRELKALAVELNVPIALIAQLNRELFKRGKGAKPQLSDLKGSGAFEQDADIVILISREQPRADDNSAAKLKGVKANLEVAKARNSRTGSAPVLFVDDNTWVGDLLE